MGKGFRIAELFNIDVRKLLRVSNSKSAKMLRASIVSFIWPQGRKIHPVSKREVTIAAIQTVRWAQEWTFSMEYGVVSRVYFLKAASGAGCLFLYHEGHEPTAITDVPAVREIATVFTGRGCDVLLISMPLHGVNAQGSIEVDGKSQPVRSNALHNKFLELESKRSRRSRILLTL